METLKRLDQMSREELYDVVRRERERAENADNWEGLLAAQVERARYHYEATSELHESWEACAGAMYDVLGEAVDGSPAQPNAAQQIMTLTQLRDHLLEWMAPPHEVIDTIDGELRRLRQQSKARE